MHTTPFIRSISRTFLAITALSAIAAAAGTAKAEAPALTLTRLLERPGAPHPLGIRNGRIPITVSLPPTIKARDIGLIPAAPDPAAPALHRLDR